MVNILKLIVISLLLFSCESIIYEDDISDKEVKLLAPANDSEFTSTTVVFNWENLKDADKYQIQIARPNFENPLEIVLDKEVTTNTHSQQLNIGAYEWRVKAINSAYETKYFTRKFRIINNDNFQNNTVILNTPVTNFNSNSLNQNLTWTPVIGATSYQLQILDNSQNVIVNQTITTSNFTYTFTQGSFSWKVRASNGNVSTLFSTRNILIDTTPPNVPSLTAPANSSTTNNTNVSFSWARTPITGSVEFDSLYVYNDLPLTSLVIKKRVNTQPHLETLTQNGIYYWRMKSFDAAGNQTSFSPTFTFTKN